MRELLLRASIRLSAEQLDQLWRYHNLIRNRNQDRDLTRITGFEPMVVKHYIDSMIVGNLWRIPSPLLDIGTGAGFPGIPLKIRYPQLEMTLAEPRPRRIEFLKEVIAELNLKKTNVFEHKVVSASFAKPVAGIITRALETIDKTILRTSACAVPGTQLIFLKGPGVDEELREAMKRFRGGIKLLMDQAYSLPKTDHQRRLIVLEKTDELGQSTKL